MRSRVGLLTLAASLPSLAYALLGAGRVREDWAFAADAHFDGVLAARGWFTWTFRPVAAPIHILVYGVLRSPLLILTVQTALVVVVAWLLCDVLGRHFPAVAFPAALLWCVMPVPSTLHFWAAGLYITAAVAMGLQSLRSERGFWWVALAAFTYEGVAVAMIPLHLWRRQWGRCAVTLVAVGLAYLTGPIQPSGPKPGLDIVLAGVLGLGVSVAVALAVIAPLVLGWRKPAVRLGLVVLVVGVAPFLAYQDITFNGLGDRALAISAFGLALAMAALTPRWALPALVAVMLILSVREANSYHLAARDTAAAVCSVDGSHVTMRPVQRGNVTALFYPDYGIPVAELELNRRGGVFVTLSAC